MTLGNSPQPLTRRQLRELAREHEPAAAEPGSEETPPAKPSSAKPTVAEPTATPAEPHHSRHTSPPVERPVDESGAIAPQASAASAPGRSAQAPAPLPIPEPPVLVDSGRTLSRREMRALQAASSASADDAAGASDHAPVVPAPVAAPRTASGEDVQPPEAPAAVDGLHPPIGHWSVDREDDSHIETIGRRDDQTFDDLVGRGVGAGGIPTTTNALILPSIPRQGPGGPITSTGEIMITGSIDLPRSLGATGQHPNLFDSSEMDRMLDQLDEGGHHNDVAPVSASRAVSTHTSTRGVMTPPRKRGASLPTVLAITAAVLAIGVLALFVVGYAFNIY
ncbi:hypothetical protein [Cryobacterium sp. W22_MBD10_FK3]|uniref:hypothetical protein n=1 Tax=Cryobacterium sp. W22_MBD10_FK3 TaxID=3240273 RepID=UPI003F907ECB